MSRGPNICSASFNRVDKSVVSVNRKPSRVGSGSVAKPSAGKGESSIDTQYLPQIENESLVVDENHNPIGVHGSSGLPGALAETEIKKKKPSKSA